MRTPSILLALLSQLVLAGVFADPPPPTVNVQGAVATGSGDPVTGTRFYRVRFYDAETLGTQLGDDLTGAVLLSSAGIFNFEVALPTPVLTVPAAWYELAIDTSDPSDGIDAGDVFANRFKINSVPFALLAADANSLGGTPAEDFAREGEVSDQFLRKDLTDEFTGGKLTVDAPLDVGKPGESGHGVRIYGASGEGRFEWDENNRALRAGQVDGTQWDPENVGTWSAALGYNTVASGGGSTALGARTTAGDDYALATGFRSAANGPFSTAMGYDSRAQGSFAFAVGYRAAAIGKETFAANRSTSATGTASAALGLETGSIGLASLAAGRETLAEGEASTALGFQTVSSGDYALAAGSRSIAAGFASVAAGYKASASGTFSFATGLDTFAIGSGAAAFGQDSIAAGAYAFAGGRGTEAAGLASTAFGSRTAATGFVSTALGRDTRASGSGSTAVGRDIEAAGAYSVAIALSDRNGESVSQDNTMSVMGGNVGLGTVEPKERLVVKANNSGFAMRVFNDGDLPDRGGIVVQAGFDLPVTGTTDYLFAEDGDGHAVGSLRSVSGVFSVVDLSDRKEKVNIRDTEVDALDIVESLRVVDYNRKTNPEGPTIHGFIAQEAQEVFPEMVTQLDQNLLGISKDALIPIFAKAFQEQQRTIEDQQRQIDELRALLLGR